MTNDDNVENSFLRRNREQLRYWPYTLYQIDETLDIALIEGKAKQILFQSLNTKSLCAFAGSGLSASYGRLSWSKWKNEQIQIVRQNAEAFLDLSKKSSKWIQELATIIDDKDPVTPCPAWAKSVHAQMNPRLATPEEDKRKRENRRNIWGWLEARRRSILMAEHEVRLLFDTFHQASSDQGSFPGGDALPVQFEIAQQLHNQIRKYVSFFLLPSEDGETISKFKDVWTGSRASPESAAPIESIGVLMKAMVESADWKGAAEEIPDICRTAKDYQKAWKHFAKESQFGASHLAFEDVTKYLLIDENAHAALLLRDGLSRSDKQNAEDVAVFEHGLGLFDATKLKRDVDGIRRAPERYLSLAPFNFNALFEAFELASSQPEYENWKTIFDRIKKDLKDYISKSAEQGDERIFLTPSSRFLLATALRLLKDPMQKKSDGKEFIDKHVTAPPATSFSSRRSIIADRFDPLAKTIRKLGIRRYITTNYDFEIERFFADAGFNQFGDPPLMSKTAEDSDFRSDHLGAELRDQTFQRDRTVELITFSMGRGSQDASVFHLHGRATKEDSLVISERDYLELYLAEDEHRESVDEAINLAFSSAPMLFIGLGMTEADMLRPLRQFISNRDRTVGYSALTLLPAEKSYAERVKTASSLYLRYGVHTIFYGSGEVSVQRPGESEKSPVGLDWLHRILAVTDVVSKHIGRMQVEVKEALADEKGKKQSLGCVSAKGKWPTEFVRMLDEAVGAMGSDLAFSSPVEAEERALNVLFGLTSYAAASKTDGSERLRVGPIAEMIGKKQGAQTNIVIPTIVPARPRNHDLLHETKSARARLDTTEYVAFYVQILEEMLRLCIKDRHEVIDKAAWTTLQNDLAARQIALDGLWGAFISTSLNAMLDSLEGEWRAWWEDWQDPPKYRTPKFERFPYFSYLPQESDRSDRTSDDEQPNERDVPDSSELPDFGGLRHSVDDEIAARALLPTPLRYIRHRVDNSITDMKEAETFTAPPQLQLNDKGVVSLEHRTHIRAFDTFIAAIAAERAALAETDRQNSISDPIPDTRRFYTVAALRGQGKGSFMTAMSSRLGLSMYIRAAWPVYGISKNGVEIVFRKQTRCAIFAGAIFVNFSFSSEISSTYDMLLEAVTETTARVQALHKVLSEQKPKLDADVQDKLIRSALQNETITTDDVAFDKLWSAFQEQVRECQKRPRKDADVLSRLGAIKKAFSDFKKASRVFKDSKLRFDEKLCIPRLLICINGIDLLYETAGREGAAKNGEIAAIISILTGDETSKVPFDLVVIGSESGIGVPWRNLRNAPKPAESEQDVLPLTLKQIDRQNIPGPAQEHIERRKASTTLNIVALNDKNAKFDGYIHFARPVSPTEMMICNFPTLARVLFLLNITSAEGRNKIGVPLLEQQGEDSLSRLNVEAQKKEACELEEIWSQPEVPNLRKLAKARNNARATINEELTKTVDELGCKAGLGTERGYLRERYQSKNKVDIDEWHRIRRHLGGNRFCLTILLGAAQHIVEHSRVLLDGAKAAEAFIRHTVDQVRNIGVYQKEDFVLRSVLECYRRYNVLGEYAADVNLHMLLIRHIAVIGTPVSGGVLVRLPEIRDYFAELRSETKISRRRIVAAALKVLCDRGLIFRLSPNANMIETNEAGKEDAATGAQNADEADARGWPLVLEFRYALHRVVQRHAASHLGQGNVDPIKNNSFAPTLYGSMSSGGPRLSRKSYVFLRRQMVSLSQYPDVPSAENEPNRIPFLENEREGAVQSLRASLSLARTSFSVASISRFADYQRLIPGAEKRGYLETYKVRLRWIIRRAWELQHKDNGFNALYRDEVVWIYNELGVTSLAQGNLTDALALLRQASELNAKIEGTQKDGHSSKLISLNHAVVQLERGRLQSARDRLRRIRDTTKPEKGTEYHMALGYLSVLDHLTGRTQELDTRFQQVTTHFQSTADKRAAAIFLQHRARFLRNSEPLRSEQFLRTARELAETGGHEDVRNHVQLAEILVSRAKADPHQAVAPELFKKLTDIERFSRHMGIWSLQCDALQLRARMLLEQGETTTSGRLLVRALAIAHRCSLTLRANRGMTLYADLLRHRGDIEGAQTIAIASLEMAKNTGFSLETVRAQAVLSQIKP